MKRNKSIILSLFLTLILFLPGCGTDNINISPAETPIEVSQQTQEDKANNFENASQSDRKENNASSAPAVSSPEISVSDIPAYSGNAYTAINNNQPYFTDSEITSVSFENYSPLDSLGRCGAASASVGKDIMPTEERGNIGQVKPTGWHTVKYDNVDGKYLYNRCHLIGYQLTGENANERNLITGTRYLNTRGMLPFENMVADYVKETGNHVMYRVTPIFKENYLLAAGVLMEGYSVEDKGDGICFNVFCYNVQPGISIDYSTGDSYAEPVPTPKPTKAPAVSAPAASADNSSSSGGNANSYIANKNTKKFHIPSCSSVDQMKESNKVYLTCSRDEMIAKGYDPCKRCNP